MRDERGEARKPSPLGRAIFAGVFAGIVAGFVSYFFAHTVGLIIGFIAGAIVGYRTVFLVEKAKAETQ